MDNISEVNGKQGFVAIEPAWHGKGTILNRPFTALEALQESGMDFEVAQTPEQYTVNRKIYTTKKMVNYRTDTDDYLGTVGNGYVPLQNRDAFVFFDSIVKKDEAIYHTAGSLGVGEKVWILAKLPHQMIIGKDDPIDNYILIHNGHNGRTAVTASMVSTRVVCENTLSVALSGATNKIAIRHTASAKEQLAEAHKLMGISTKYYDEFQKILTAMSHKQVQAKDIEFFLDSVYPLNPENDTRTAAVKIREGIMESFETGVGQDMITTKGTVYGLFNGFTHYTDHVKEFDNADSKLKSLWFGSMATKRQKAFDALAELAIS
jgi:phage/plasmid-like protein (TIGR03299 family)